LPRDGDKLASLPLADLLAAQARAGGFRPVVDGTILPRAPVDAAGAAEGPGVPLLVGTARDETRVVDLVEPGLAALRREELPARLVAEGVPAELAAEAVEHDLGTPPPALFHRVATELLYRSPAQRLADQAAARGAPVFQYRFELSGAAASGDTGAFHGLDLPLVFGTRRITPLGRFFESVPEAKPVGRRMRDAFAAFASTGAPRSPLVGAWPRHTPLDRAVYAFNALE
jgi:para-nitrobenzyl esterase